MDFAAAGLLDGLEGREREARQRLLEHLHEQGVSLEELKAAVAEDRLALLPVERVLGGRHSAREVEQRIGLPASLALRIRRLQGLPEASPDDKVFGDEDLEAFKSTRLFLEVGLDEQAIAELTRVLGEAMARVANTTAATFVGAFLKPGDSEQDVAIRFAELAEQLTPALGPVLLASFQGHLREAIRRGMLGRTERETGQIAGDQEMAVCFADLVGFTRLGGELEAQQLGNVVGQFSELASEVTREPVRLIKTIGDAAMFVSPDPEPLVAVALSLVDAAAAAELPSLRAGIAYGPALARAGDFYGNAVNLASRVTGVARPGSVLCTQEVRDAAPGAFEWSFAGRHRLKGVGEALPLHRARWQPEHEGATAAPQSANDRERPATRRRADRRRKREAS